MKKLFIAFIISSVFQYTTCMATEEAASDKEGIGFGLGAIVGGLIAGPPGAVIGAAAGTWFGGKETQEDKKLHALEKQVQDKEIEIAYLQEQFDLAQSRFEHDLQKVKLERVIKSLDSISNGITFSIHFRTASYSLEQDLNEKINKLAQLLQHYPNIQILLEGYADERGSRPYNFELSKKRLNNVRAALTNAGIPANRINAHAYGETRATSAIGDMEGYMFDRRVIILLTLDKQV